MTSQRRALLPLSDWEERVAWRDRALIAAERARRAASAMSDLPPTPGLTSRAMASQLETGTRPAARPRDFNQSLERGLEIIQTFGAAAPRQTVSEVAARTGADPRDDAAGSC